MAKQHAAGVVDTHKSLILQVVIILIVCAAYAWFKGLPAAKAGLYGGLTVFLNSLLLSWHMRRADRVAGDSAERSLRIVYLCAAERLVLTIGLLALGISIIKLEPLPLIVGFIVAQIAVITSNYMVSDRE